MYPQESFISQVDKESFNIYYKDKKNFFCYEIRTPGDAASFLYNYEELDWFCNGYGRGIDWRYKKESNELTPYFDISNQILVSKAENYEIMKKRPHVAFNGNLVNALKRNIPFEIAEGNSFFVIDEYTRMIGWFYFKSSYNGKDFIGCYPVDGWDSNTTYEDLVNLQGGSLKFKNYTFLISN